MKTRSLAGSFTAFLCVACVHTGRDEARLRDLWVNPERHDGEEFALTVFPHDNGSRGSFTLCFEPCSPAEAERELAVIRPAIAGRFEGADGQRPFQVRVVFRADCFRTNALCGHSPFIFEEIAP